MRFRAILFLAMAAALPFVLAACSASSTGPVDGSQTADSPDSSTTDATKPAGDPASAETSKTDVAVATTAAKAKTEVAPAKKAGLTKGGTAPAKSDTLLLYYAADPDTINAVTSSDTTSSTFQQWVYEALAEVDMANPDELKPSLAERWEFDDKELLFTIHLRKGVKWHPMKLPNGKALPSKEFTARDVKFTFDCILNTNIDAASLRSYYEDPEAKEESEKFKIKVTVVDDYTVKVKWSKPYFQAAEFTLGIPIIPRHVYSVNPEGEPISFDFSSKEFAEGFNNHWANRLMCGTGPMILKEWVKDTRLVVERNPDYWGEPFYFSTVVFRSIPNTNTARQLMLQNDLDWGSIPEKDQYIQTKDHPSVTSGKVKLVEYPYPAYRYIGYNNRKAFFKDKNVRMALSHAVPIENIIDVVYKGLAKPTSGPFLPGSSAEDKSLAPIPYDLDRARAMLDEAGWKDSDGDGIRDKVIDGVKVPAAYELLIVSDAPQFLTIAEMVKEESRKIGVDVSIAPNKWANMLQRLRKKDFDACMLGWALGWKQDLFQIWHGSQADVPESSNSIGYQNAELDKLIEELRVTMDTDKQIELYHQMHRIIYEDQPYTFLFVDVATGAHHSRLQNIKFYKPRPCVDLREWSADVPRLSE